MFFVCLLFLAEHLLLDGQLGSFSLRKTNFPLLSLNAHSFPSRGGPYELSLKSQSFGGRGEQVETAEKLRQKGRGKGERMNPVVKLDSRL